VEIYVSMGLSESMEFVLKDNMYTHILDYVNIPLRCSHCLMYGHILKDCSKPYVKMIWQNNWDGDTKGERESISLVKSMKDAVVGKCEVVPENGSRKSGRRD